jgi:hypothetical protein
MSSEGSWLGSAILTNNHDTSIITRIMAYSMSQSRICKLGHFKTETAVPFKACIGYKACVTAVHNNTCVLNSVYPGSSSIRPQWSCLANRFRKHSSMNLVGIASSFLLMFLPKQHLLLRHSRCRDTLLTL